MNPSTPITMSNSARVRPPTNANVTRNVTNNPAGSTTGTSVADSFDSSATSESPAATTDSEESLCDSLNELKLNTPDEIAFTELRSTTPIRRIALINNEWYHQEVYSALIYAWSRHDYEVTAYTDLGARCGIDLIMECWTLSHPPIFLPHQQFMTDLTRDETQRQINNQQKSKDVSETKSVEESSEASSNGLFDSILVVTMYDEIVSDILKHTSLDQHIIIMVHCIDDDREVLRSCNNWWLDSTATDQHRRISFLTLAPHVQSSVKAYLKARGTNIPVYLFHNIFPLPASISFEDPLPTVTPPKSTNLCPAEKRMMAQAQTSCTSNSSITSPIVPPCAPRHLPCGSRCDFILQGYFEGYRRNYSDLFEGLIHMQERNHPLPGLLGATPTQAKVLDEVKAPTDEEVPIKNVSIAHPPPLTLHLVGRMKPDLVFHFPNQLLHGPHHHLCESTPKVLDKEAMLPTWFSPRLSLHYSPSYPVFYSLIRSCCALLTAFPTDHSDYLRTRGSSTVPASLITETPLLTDANMLQSYTHLTSSCLWLKHAGESDSQAMERIYQLPQVERSDQLAMKVQELKRLKQLFYEQNQELIALLMNQTHQLKESTKHHSNHIFLRSVTQCH